MAQDQHQTKSQAVIAMVNSFLPKCDEINIIPSTKLEWLIVNEDSQFYIGYDDRGPAFGHIVDANSSLLKSDAEEELQFIRTHFDYQKKMFAIGVRDDDVCLVQTSF